MTSTSTFTYNDGLYVPWTSPVTGSTPAPAMTTAPATSATSRWSLTTTEEVDYTTTQAFVEQSTADAATTTMTTQWQAQTTSASAAVVQTTSASAFVVPTTQTPTTLAEPTTPPPTSEDVTTITNTPLSTSTSTISRSVMVVGTPMATATAKIGATSQDSSSTTSHEGDFKKIYLLLLLLLVPFIIIATIMIIRRRRRSQRRHARGDPYDEEGGLVVGGKFVGDDDYSEKNSIKTVQRRSSKWSSFILKSLGIRSGRRDDAMSEISEGPSLPFRAVSYSSVHGGGNGGPEDQPFQPPMEDRAIDFNRLFNTLPRVDERDTESGNVPTGRWELAPSGLGAAADTALDAGKRMLGGWGWSSKSRRLELVPPRFDGSANTRGSMRIPSPSIYSPNSGQSGPYDGLQGIDEDEDDYVDLDAYLGESRVHDSSLASRYLDDPESVPVKEDYRLPLSPKGPKPMPRPGMVIVDLPATPSRTFNSPTKKSGILPATDRKTPPPNGGLLFKYDSSSTIPIRDNIPTPSSPRPPLPTPPKTNTRTLPEPQTFHSKTVNLGGVYYDPPVTHNFKPLTPATYRAHRSPRQLPKKPSSDLFAQAMSEPESIVVPTSGTIRLRKKQNLPEITSSPNPIIEFDDSSKLEPLRHPSKVKNVIYDFEKRTKETTTTPTTMMTSPTKIDLMSHHSPARNLPFAPSLKQTPSVGKLLLARRTELPSAESTVTDDHDNDDEDDASVYSVDESVIAERPVYQNNNNAKVMTTLAGARYKRPVIDSKPLSSDPKRLSAMLRRPSLPQLKDEEGLKA